MSINYGKLCSISGQHRHGEHLQWSTCLLTSNAAHMFRPNKTPSSDLFSKHTMALSKSSNAYPRVL